MLMMMPFADGAEMAEACVDSQRHVVREMAMQTNHDLVGRRRNCEGGVQWWWEWWREEETERDEGIGIAE